MKRVFGAKKNKEPPPTIQDATDRVLLFDPFILFLPFKDLSFTDPYDGARHLTGSYDKSYDLHGRKALSSSLIRSNCTDDGN